MKILKITTIDRHTYYLKPCAVVHHNIAVQMLSDVRSGAKELCQRLINLFPRADSAEYGIPLTELPNDMIGEIFETDRCVVEQLLELPPQETVKPSIKNPPLKSTDNPIMDIFARLSVAIGVEQAWLLIKTLSFDELIDWQKSYNECSRPIEDRRQEYIDKLWVEQVAATPQDFYHNVILNLKPIGGNQ